MWPFLSRSVVTHYISPDITVGFCQYGPTLGISGVLSTAKQVALINSMSLSVKAPFHTLKKEFEWFSITDKADPGHEAYADIQPPLKFVLSADHPCRYTALFADTWHYAEMKPLLMNITAAWQEEMTIRNTTDRELLFQDFQTRRSIAEMTGRLEDMCYWKPGRYPARVTVAAKHNVFYTEKNFRLEPAQAEVLKTNALQILAAVCGQPSPVFTNVHVSLND